MIRHIIENLKLEMPRFYNDDAIQEILKEESSLRNELYSIISSILKYFATFDNRNFAKMLLEYLRFYNMLRSFAILPHIKNQKDYERSFTYPPLSIEDLKIAEVIKLLPLKLSTFEKKLKNRVKILKDTDSNF